MAYFYRPDGTWDLSPSLRYDFSFALRRAGVLFYWNFAENAYVVESKYNARFRVSGNSEESALKSYAEIIQQPRIWRQIAEEMCAQNQFFVERLDQRKREEQIPDTLSSGVELTVNNPMHFWQEVLLPTFKNAFDGQKDIDTINRVYAFADWSTFQTHDELNPSKHLPSCAMICFYERVLRFPEALADMPNWFKPSEIDWLFLDLCNEPYLGKFRHAFGIS
jgi:hypothetical protein